MPVTGDVLFEQAGGAHGEVMGLGRIEEVAGVGVVAEDPDGGVKGPVQRVGPL